jgi:hypothetical protein
MTLAVNDSYNSYIIYEPTLTQGNTNKIVLPELHVLNNKNEDIDSVNYDSVKQYERNNAANEKNDDKADLTNEEQEKIKTLNRIHTEVHLHEKAHISAAGGLARGGANYVYTTGPDGKQYAVGGEVHIDMSVGNTPAQTIKKMQQVIRAALAPTDPSDQDYAVAASARRIMADAKLQKADETKTEQNVNQNYNNNTITAPITSKQLSTYNYNENYNAAQPQYSSSINQIA